MLTDADSTSDSTGRAHQVGFFFSIGLDLGH